MASITERKAKDGAISFRILVRGPRDPLTGKRKSYSKTWNKPEGWSKKATQRELNRIAGEFESACMRGEILTKEEEKQKAIQEAETKRLEAESAPTVNQFIQTYLTHSKRTLKKTTLDMYKAALKAFSRKYGEMKMKDIKKKDIQIFLEESEDSGLKNATVRGRYRVLNCFFDYAEEQEIIENNPMSKVKPPKPSEEEKKRLKEKESQKALTVEEVKKLLQALQFEPLMTECFFNLLIDTGCRIGELQGLTWEAVDLDKGTITIKQNVGYTKETGWFIQTPKSETSNRPIVLNSPALKVLKEWREAAILVESGLVFYGQKLDIWPRKTIEQALERVCKKNGLRKITPHMLRHTWATLALANGADIVSVSKKLGHSSVSITLDIYSHANLEAQMRANDIMAKTIYEDENEAPEIQA